MRTEIPTVTVLLEGFIEKDGDVIRDASSSVVLVRSSAGAVIVDTGSPRDCKRIVTAMKTHGLRPCDVGMVVNTHLHVDHCGCNDMFENAKHFAHSLEDPSVGTVRVSAGTTIVPGVEIVPTPGHSPGSVSVFARAERRYAICGDAIPTKANYDSHVPPFIAFDKALARKSMEMIIAWADVVVPGHDAPFEVIRKK